MSVDGDESPLERAARARAEVTRAQQAAAEAREVLELRERYLKAAIVRAQPTSLYVSPQLPSERAQHMATKAKLFMNRSFTPPATRTRSRLARSPPAGNLETRIIARHIKDGDIQEQTISAPTRPSFTPMKQRSVYKADPPQRTNLDGSEMRSPTVHGLSPEQSASAEKGSRSAADEQGPLRRGGAIGQTRRTAALWPSRAHTSPQMPRYQRQQRKHRHTDEATPCRSNAMTLYAQKLLKSSCRGVIYVSSWRGDVSLKVRARGALFM